MCPRDLYSGGGNGKTGHEGGVLSEKMCKQLRKLGITEFFAGAFLFLFLSHSTAACWQCGMCLSWALTPVLCFSAADRSADGAAPVPASAGNGAAHAIHALQPAARRMHLGANKQQRDACIRRARR
jgi:hypothetical protein